MLNFREFYSITSLPLHFAAVVRPATGSTGAVRPAHGRGPASRRPGSGHVPVRATQRGGRGQAPSAAAGHPGGLGAPVRRVGHGGGRSQRRQQQQQAAHAGAAAAAARGGQSSGAGLLGARGPQRRVHRRPGNGHGRPVVKAAARAAFGLVTCPKTSRVTDPEAFRFATVHLYVVSLSVIRRG